MTRLRKMMLEELQRRNYSDHHHAQLPAGGDRVRQVFWQVSRQARPQRTSNLSSLSAAQSAS